MQDTRGILAPLLCEPSLPGLLWAMQFDAAGRGRPLAPGEPVPERPVHGFLWLHLNLVDARLGALVAEGRFGPPALVAAAFAADPHQRVAIEDAQVGGVVADLVRAGAEDRQRPGPDAAGRLHFVMAETLIVTGRRHPIQGPDTAHDAATAGRLFPAPAALLEHIVGGVVAEAVRNVALRGDELDEIEDHILDDQVRDETRRLGPIRREAVRLRRHLLGLASVFHRLEEEEDEGLPEPVLSTAARMAQRVDALDRDMQALAERSRLLQDELAAQLARASNRQLHTLSILTALFLPPTLVTGLFGMNTKGLPFSEMEDGSTLAMILAVVSAVAVFLLIRRMGIGPSRDR
ncbi:CorA family divalent cation transporter [Methylorubrum salsuginis]|uniref:Zinc transporter n=1 Tax=Methylorubrum salsuginis TaxID=414703 RepID=A0A1I4GPE3_9HYPH|nr:CorA family divalent cation transporter [Methylorubrum salsuginis]SFL31247.1 zinc transporter [Methylorubrum salsuginis]